MNLAVDPQLLSELQELYLRNKQWLSDVMFLENESRFFQKLFNKILSSTVMEGSFEKVHLIDLSLSELEERRNKLREMVNSYQHSLESLMTDNNKKIGLELIIENEEVNNEIKSLLNTDKLVKRELFTLVEAVIRKDKTALLDKLLVS